jgi:hypothetical protein
MTKNAVYPDSAQLYIERLEKQLAGKDRIIQNLKSQNFMLTEKLKLALYRKFCKTSEKDKGQLSLFAAECLSDNPEEVKKEAEYMRTVIWMNTANGCRQTGMQVMRR